MTFRLSLNTSTIKPQPLLEKVRIAAEAGYDGIELWVNDIYEFVGQGGEVGEVQRALRDHGLQTPSMIALRGWGEAAPLEYPLMIDEAKRRMELARRFDCPYLVCSPPRERCAFSQIADRYADLLEVGRSIGVKPTFEYISFFNSVASLEQGWAVVNRVSQDPHATIILDAFHSWNTNSSLDTLRQIPASRISHYHIDDAAAHLTPGKQRDPDRVMVGDGVIDLVAELRVLIELGYNGWISLELFNPALWDRDPLEVARLGRDRILQTIASATE
ncbi:MAG: sugar phosphate isomerase/epimerase [Pirellulaceae bacterium]|jgi:sugar phosphate isomerase/epimerase|nr:sugar phosphate isomerase/epimerase [Pirellulaceae bacterium]MDP7016860.1 sugar phosphate isomerase/epimerase [Pirellulaceae bacterium]